MSTVLYLTSAAANAVGGTFYDALPAQGSGVATAVVNTVASGINIQWTRTAGGTVLEWISGPSPAGGWTLSGAVAAKIWAMESLTLANAGVRLRLYKRSVLGVETELPGSPYDKGAELTTSLAAVSYSFTPSSGTAFAEDERLVIRPFITAAGGTMSASRTCTLQYDDSSGNSADSTITLTETVLFKAEASAAEAASAAAAAAADLVTGVAAGEAASAAAAADALVILPADAGESASASAAGDATLSAAVDMAEAVTAGDRAFALVIGRTGGRLVSEAMAEALAGAIVYPVFQIELDFPDGILRLSTELQDRVWNGQIWRGVGWVIGVGDVEEAGDIRATSVTIGLRGNSPELISVALRNVRQNLPGKIWFGLLTPGMVLGSDDTLEVLGDDDGSTIVMGEPQGALIDDPVLAFSGLLDIASIVKDPANPAVTIAYKSRLADLQRVRVRRYTHEDQQIDHPGDMFFQYAGTLADAQFPWGLGYHPNAVR